MDFETQRGVQVGGSGCGCTGCFGVGFSMLLSVAIGVLVFAAIALSTSESDTAAIAAFNACPSITAELGSPIRESTISMGCGESQTGGGAGNAEWTMSIEGPRGSASAWYAASYSGGQPWVVNAANVTLADGRSLTAVPCTATRDPKHGEPVEGPRDRPDRPDRDDRDRKGGKRH